MHCGRGKHLRGIEVAATGVAEPDHGTRPRAVHLSGQRVARRGGNIEPSIVVEVGEHNAPTGIGSRVGTHAAASGSIEEAARRAFVQWERFVS
jgi:hypothetical protein